MGPSFARLFPARQACIAAALVIATLAAPFGPANATGTARILQSDGSDKTYNDVRIAVRDESMWMTSSDGVGTIVLGQAACTKVGELLRCLPYDAMLVESGRSTHVALQSGTVWLNPTTTAQPLTYSSMQVPPHGVLVALRTKKGTYVTLTGIVDEIKK
jgi:hypothetical protein